MLQLWKWTFENSATIVKINIWKECSHNVNLAFERKNGNLELSQLASKFCNCDTYVQSHNWQWISIDYSQSERVAEFIIHTNLRATWHLLVWTTRKAETASLFFTQFMCQFPLIICASCRLVNIKCKIRPCKCKTKYPF